LKLLPLDVKDLDGLLASQGVNLRASGQLLIFPPITDVVAGEVVVPTVDFSHSVSMQVH
jgi:hypothetical protein